MTTQPIASKANQEEIKAKQSWLQKIQIFTTVLVAIFGGITSWIAMKNAEKLNMLTHEVERHQRFVDEIGEVTSTLSENKEAQAKMSFTRLFALAQNKNDKDVLLNIAVASGKESLIATMIDLVKDDPAFQDPNNPAFQENHSRVAFEAAKNRLVEVVIKEEVQESNESDVPPAIIEAGLLDKLTPENTTGWILLGEKNGDENLQSEVISDAKLSDLINKTKELMTEVNLRDSEDKAIGQGNIIGIISKGSEVNIKEIKPVVNSLEKTEIWGKVTIVEKGSS